MSAHLRHEQCCTAVGCMKPARELGKLCTTHWQALSPEARAFLSWEALWTIEPPATYSVVGEAEEILRSVA